MDTRRCPCGSLEDVGACCGRYLGDDGAAPPTAEALMRSRYTAFVRGDVDHLLRTWHPDTRPATLELDPGVRWTGLEVLERVGGGPFDAEGVVEFRAHHERGGRAGVQQERSRFLRDAGRWVYVDGVVAGSRRR
ncbi:YchJ family protein [Actinomycetospora lemnae]|uniref:YchJ family protein n=1 Tax=Actinomycetospora lemnae TaxID=3019891 RepID=UPI0038CBF74C